MGFHHQSVLRVPRAEAAPFLHSAPKQAASFLSVYFTISMGGKMLPSWSREQIVWQSGQTVLWQFGPLNQGTELPSIFIWQQSGMFQGPQSQMGGKHSLWLCWWFLCGQSAVFLAHGSPAARTSGQTEVLRWLHPVALTWGQKALSLWMRGSPALGTWRWFVLILPGN